MMNTITQNLSLLPAIDPKSPTTLNAPAPLPYADKLDSDLVDHDTHMQLTGQVPPQKHDTTQGKLFLRRLSHLKEKLEKDVE